MTRVLGILAFLVILTGIIFYAAGWLSWDTSRDRATIEIETREIQEASDRVVEQGKRAVDQAVEAVQSIGTDREAYDADDVDRQENVQP